MNAERRAQLVTLVDELRDTRQKLLVIARRQAQLEKAAREHAIAARGDAQALFAKDQELLEKLHQVLTAETLGEDGAEALGALRRTMRWAEFV